MGVHRLAELLEVVRTGDAASGLASRLHGRQEQADENADDRDHDKQFHERETAIRSRCESSSRLSWQCNASAPVHPVVHDAPLFIEYRLSTNETQKPPPEK